MPPPKNPLSAPAAAYRAQIEQRRQISLERISALPMAILIWGPNPESTSPVAKARVMLRDELIKNGHLAEFSEDLIDNLSPHSIVAQQMSHVEAADIVFSLPDAPGSIAEIHQFSKMPHLSHKIVTFIDCRWNGGFSNQALLDLRTAMTCDVVGYDHLDLPDCIVQKALDAVRRLQVVHYGLGRRP